MPEQPWLDVEEGTHRCVLGGAAGICVLNLNLKVAVVMILLISPFVYLSLGRRWMDLGE